MRDVFPGGRHRSPLSVPAVFQLTVSSLPAGVLIRGFDPLCGYMTCKSVPVTYLRLYCTETGGTGNNLKSNRGSLSSAISDLSLVHQSTESRRRESQKKKVKR